MSFVLVFDLDETITTDYFSKQIKFNKNITDLLYYARANKKVAAILLLTNNSDKQYINKVINTLNIPIFDDIMIRTDTRRPDHRKFDPIKNLENVRTMLKGLGLSTAGLAKRTYFFDDRCDHVIRSEIPADNYIHILKDFTDLSGIYKLLGKSRKTRKVKK